MMIHRCNNNGLSLPIRLSSCISPSISTSMTKPLHSVKSPFSLSSRPRWFPLKILKISAVAMKSTSQDDYSLPSSSDVPESLDEAKPQRVKLALERAGEYKKKSVQLDEIQKNDEYPVGDSAGVVDGSTELVYWDEDGEEKKAKEYQEDQGIVGSGNSNGERENTQGNVGGEEAEIPEAVRISLVKAKAYKKNKGTIDDGGTSLESTKLTEMKGGRSIDLRTKTSEKNIEKEELKISSLDFVGLNFTDKKKSRGLPAGLVPIVDPFPQGDLPEVEILVGDASKFGNAVSPETKSSSEEESVDLYKPKVSTWGMFPRPSNISQTFGGGRNIRPGEELETPEGRAAKEARTRQLLAAYKRKIGLKMDPMLKAECEKALKDGDALMNVGRLKEALPCYQQVMHKLAFQTELHGLAALQWSICQDSLGRPEEARIMYEKLQSHPHVQVSKKAREFMFSFQAMEMMKVTRSTRSPTNTGYQKFFEAFVEDEENYTSRGTEAEEGTLNQALPYVVFLASPILLVLIIAASKGI